MHGITGKHRGFLPISARIPRHFHTPFADAADPISKLLGRALRTVGSSFSAVGMVVWTPGK